MKKRRQPNYDCRLFQSCYVSLRTTSCRIRNPLSVSTLGPVRWIYRQVQEDHPHSNVPHLVLGEEIECPNLGHCWSRAISSYHSVVRTFVENVCFRLTVSCSQYRGAVGALIVYDITKRETFFNAQEWLKKAQDFGESQIVISLVGNKCDLKHVRAVTTEEAKEFAGRSYLFQSSIVVNVNSTVANNLLFMETSALDATNIDAAFEELLGNIYNIVASKNLSPTAEKSNIRPLGRTSLILPSEPQKKDSTGCC